MSDFVTDLRRGSVIYRHSLVFKTYKYKIHEYRVEYVRKKRVHVLYDTVDSIWYYVGLRSHNHFHVILFRSNSLIDEHCFFTSKRQCESFAKDVCRCLKNPAEYYASMYADLPEDDCSNI